MQQPAPFIDLSSLRVFLLTAQERNMSSAATRLGLTQPAVSQTLRALEDQLGIVLLNRGERPLTLTPAGLLLAERGTAVMDSALDLRTAVVEVGQGLNPSMRLGLVDSFAASCGAQLVRELAGFGSRLSVRTGLSPDLGKGLLARDFDLVITSDALEEADGIDRHALLHEGFVVITPKAQKTALHSMADLKALADAMPMIRFNRESHLGSQIDQIVRRHGIKAGRSLEIDTSEVVTSMVVGELGWAMTTPVCLLQAQHLSSQVKVASIPDLTGTRSLHLLARRDQHQQVVSRVLKSTHGLLANDMLPRLAAIDACLPPLVQLCAPYATNPVQSHSPPEPLPP